MENRFDLDCHVIEDLMPSYVDGLCSKESAQIIEGHIAHCEKCNGRLIRMKDDSLRISDMPPESEELLALSDRVRAREKRQKRMSVSLGIISAGLAVCLVVSLSPIGRIAPSSMQSAPVNIAADTQTSGSGNDTASRPGSDEASLLGLASADKLGDYTAAADYGQIYDYMEKNYGYQDRMFDFGFMTNDDVVYKTEAVAEEAAMDVDAAGPMEAPMAASTADSNGAAGAGAGFSTTNLMTEGVDESDISKTDGQYIYNATGSEIIIFDIREKEAKEISRIVPDFEAPSDVIREIFIDGDTMSIITEHAEMGSERFKDETFIIVYDITDRQKASLKGRYKQDGAYHTSRKTGDIIYLFTNQYIEDPGTDRAKATSTDGIGSWFPTINDKVISSDCVYMPQTGRNSLVVSSFDQNEPQKTIDTKVIVNEYCNIYVGSESIYLYSDTYSGGRTITKISKLSYSDGKIVSGETTSVRGYLNDSFAINEYKGYLRLVTTEWDGGSSNMLYVFDDQLKECGRISNIANGEMLYACRFMGDTGYFVTYENTDPLFTVDLKDPKNPTIIGELELYGFSEYLHFWGEGKLLGIGYESDAKGERQGLKLSMFDITDPANVTEEGRLVLEGADHAPGFYDYKAILASPGANLIGFAYEDYDDENWIDNKSFYEVFSYEDGQFTRKISEEIDEDRIGRARGHYSGDYFYLSQDTTVKSMKY